MTCRTIGFPRTARAFTLIELLVVVSILALLISILLPSLAGARAAAQRAAGAANLSGLGKAFHTHAAENEGKVPISMRGAYPTSGMAFMQRIAYRTDTPSVSIASALAPYLPDGVHSKVWQSPGNNSVNPFNVLMYGDPTKTWSEPNWYEFRLKQGSLAGSKSMVNLSYLFFIGDPGNTASDFYFRDEGMSQPFHNLNQHETRMSGVKPTYIILQDLAVRDVSGFYQTNYSRNARLQPTSFTSSGFQTYSQGFNFGDAESTIVGGNVLFGDGSARWFSRNEMVKVYAPASKSGGGTMTFYVGAQQ